MWRSAGILARGQCAPARRTHCNVGCYLLCSPWLKNVCGVAASDITSKPQNTRRLKAALMSERQNIQLFSPAQHIKTSQTTLYIRPFGCFSLWGRQTRVRLALSVNIPSDLFLFSPLWIPHSKTRLSCSSLDDLHCVCLAFRFLFLQSELSPKQRRYDLSHKTTRKVTRQAKIKWADCTVTFPHPK